MTSSVSVVPSSAKPYWSSQIPLPVRRAKRGRQENTKVPLGGTVMAIGNGTVVATRSKKFKVGDAVTAPASAKFALKVDIFTCVDGRPRNANYFEICSPGI